MSPTIAVNPVITVNGVDVCCIWPATLGQTSPPRPYAHDGEDDSLVAAYEAAYPELAPRSLSEWRKL